MKKFLILMIFIFLNTQMAFASSQEEVIANLNEERESLGISRAYKENDVIIIEGDGVINKSDIERIVELSEQSAVFIRS